MKHFNSSPLSFCFPWCLNRRQKSDSKWLLVCSTALSWQRLEIQCFGVSVRRVESLESDCQHKIKRKKTKPERGKSNSKQMTATLCDSGCLLLSVSSYFLFTLFPSLILWASCARCRLSFVVSLIFLLSFFPFSFHISFFPRKRETSSWKIKEVKLNGNDTFCLYNDLLFVWRMNRRKLFTFQFP